MQVLKCTRKLLDARWVEAEAGRITALLARTNPIAVFLFGSAAENKMTDQSDFDFLVLFDSPTAIKQAQIKLRPHYPLCEYPVDIVWMLKDTFDEKKDIGGIAFTANREGRCLYSAQKAP